MDTVEVPLNSFRYRFRRLNWREELSLPRTQKEDHRKTILAHALVDVSGMPIRSVEDARRILDRIPLPIFWRVFVTYRGNLPADRYYTSTALYEAPDRAAHERKTAADEEAVGSAIDAAQKGQESRLGHKESVEARELEALMVADAKRRGVLVPATS